MLAIRSRRKSFTDVSLKTADVLVTGLIKHKLHEDCMLHIQHVIFVAQMFPFHVPLSNVFGEPINSDLRNKLCWFILIFVGRRVASHTIDMSTY